MDLATEGDESQSTKLTRKLRALGFSAVWIRDLWITFLVSYVRILKVNACYTFSEIPTKSPSFSVDSKGTYE